MNEALTKNETTPITSAESQFGLVTLFYVMSVYTVGLALGAGTLLASTIALCFWGVRRQYGWTGAMGLLGLLFVFGLLQPTVLVTPRHHSLRTHCLNNVRTLTLAVINYEDDKGNFPPAYLRDENAKPMLSWRVLILPQMGYEKLYDQFELDRPWDSSVNLKLLDQMPPEFQCPSNPEPGGHTPYKLVVDEGTTFELERVMDYGDILDGSSNTLGIVEDAHTPVPWTKPEDLTLEQAVAVLVPEDPSTVSHSIRSTFRTAFLGSSVSRMDGSVDFIGPTVNRVTACNLCLCNDGEVVDWDDTGASIAVTHRDKYFVLAIYVCLLILPGFFLSGRPLRKFNWRHY